MVEIRVSIEFLMKEDGVTSTFVVIKVMEKMNLFEMLMLVCGIS